MGRKESNQTNKNPDDITEGFTKVDFKNQQMTKKHANIHVCNVKIVDVWVSIILLLLSGSVK